MASVSILLVGAICLFCTLTYLCSAGIFFLCWQLNEDKFAKLKDDMIDIFQNSKEVSILVVMIPVLSFLIHSSIASEKLGQIKELSRYGIEQWEFAPSKQFDQSPSFTIGVETSSAKMRIVEFADYMCIHCKQASPVLKAFVSAHPDVSLSFYNFPLDGRCNSAIEQAGRSCDLAKASVCAEMKWKKGSLASEFLFAQFGSVDASNVSEKLAKELSVDSKELQSCIDSEESLRLVKMQADLGNRVNVKGTPSIFINERPLQGGAMLPVLEAVYKKINNQ